MIRAKPPNKIRQRSGEACRELSHGRPVTKGERRVTEKRFEGRTKTVWKKLSKKQSRRRRSGRQQERNQDCGLPALEEGAFMKWRTKEMHQAREKRQKPTIT